MISNDKKAVLHIAKSKCLLGDKAEKDAEYRQILSDITGKTSSADPDFNYSDFRNVMKFFNEKLGFRKISNQVRYMTDKQYKEIRRLERVLGWKNNPRRLKGFSKRTIHKYNWRQATKREASQLITGLRRLQNEQRRK